MFEDKFYELEVTIKKDLTPGQNKREFDNAYDAETKCYELMGTGVKADNVMDELNIVLGADGSVFCNEFFSKVPIGGTDVIKYHLFYVESFNDDTPTEVTFNRFDSLDGAVGAYYSKRGASRVKENLETAMCKVFNSHGGFEGKYCYSWDKNPAPEPEPNTEE